MGGRKFENNEDQKKGLHPDSARFSAQIAKGGHDVILHSILRYLCITVIPKGGPWHNAPLTVLLVVTFELGFYIESILKSFSLLFLFAKL